MSDSPRIYVASLSDYNAGRLWGRWIDAEQEADVIGREVAQLLHAATLAHPLDGTREEWAIHDTEGFRGIEVGEFDSFERVAAIAEALGESGEPDAFAAWYSSDIRDINDGAAELVEQFLCAYLGEWDDVEAYAFDLAQDLGWVSALEGAGMNPSYFDAAQFAVDLVAGGDIWTEQSPMGLFVFAANV